MLAITINEKTIETPGGATILDVARVAGIYIPTLCDYPGVSPDGCCRVCLVEVEGSPKLVAACTTPVVNGMRILTHSKKVLETRRTIVELMLVRHPLECTTCTSHGDCELARLCRELDIRTSRYASELDEAHRYPIDDKNPFILRDRNKCVLCGRCVRVCDAFAQYHAIDLQGRSSRVIVDTA
ncbi:(2Fe-2S)-binding protein, partial [Synergistaceae bacterium OttesenSCG-928-I11]|nr:(2Fe-2S)-binding protein [Synergistaceae bacterium OttesenSCG-928-I11]